QIHITSTRAQQEYNRRAVGCLVEGQPAQNNAIIKPSEGPFLSARPTRRRAFGVGLTMTTSGSLVHVVRQRHYLGTWRWHILWMLTSPMLWDGILRVTMAD